MNTIRAILVAACLVLGGSHLCAQTLPGPALSPQDQLELQTYVRQLADPQRDSQTKLEAATILLGKPYAEAAAALAGFLTDPANRPAQIAVARAVAASGLVRDELAEPLLGLLQDKEPSVRSAAAAALAVYRNGSVLRRLSDIARSARAEEPARVAAMQALSRMPDKTAVDTLIGLLDAPEPGIRAAAAEALLKLTGIRTFGADAARWRAWWLANKDKSRQQWMDDLLDALSRQNAELESANARLRARLATAMTDLYAAAAEAARPALLLSYLRDPLSDVRLAGVQLTLQRLHRTETVAPESARLAEALVGDEDARVRASAAPLWAALGGAESLAPLTRRLEVESVETVREALVAAIGSLAAPESLDVLLKAMADEPNGPAVAAALAITRLAERKSLAEPQLQRIAEVVAARYGRTQPSQGKLREALLALMGTLGRAEFIEPMRAALRQEPATVRVAAVRGLQKLRDADGAAQVEPLLGDADRGVRQAALAALGTLGDLPYLPAVLRYTDAQVEGDSGVRQQAWETAMALLAEAPVAQVAAVAAGLEERPDAGKYHIRALTLLVEKLAEDLPAQAEARVRLAKALQAANLPSEAAKELFRAYRSVEADSTRAGQLWVDWMMALLAADDPSMLTYLAEQQDQSLFTPCVEALMERLTTLEEQGRTETLIMFCEQCGTRLGQRLEPEQAALVKTVLDRTRASQREADRASVQRLVAELTSADEARRRTARGELELMRARAVPPLIEQLQAAAASQPANSAAETAIVDVLARLAPDLQGYDPKAQLSEKERLLRTWLDRLNGN